MARQLVVNKKTGYKVNDIYQPIIIRDYRGILFYSTEPLLPKVREFNLPMGSYIVDTGYFSPMNKPVEYGRIKLPFPERLLPSTDNFAIEFAPNPNKCTIYWDLRKIVFDTAFRDKPLYELFSIRFHEDGHKRYNTEKYADIYAANKMLDMGFNPYYTGIAPLDSLSNKQIERKNFVIQNLERYVLPKTR
jgi:hypothetical protein